ncbi:hypothetical protein KY346_06550 [Candidatus Woesearchaeota archaeon]|nr:hypothetical protein [Candidatus Woesearchaeota archaeon]
MTGDPLYEFLKTASAEQLDLLANVVEALARERQLSEQITNISDRNDISAVCHRTISEDPTLIPSALKLERKETRAEIKAYLQTAIKQFGNVDFIRSCYRDYVGDLPE